MARRRAKAEAQLSWLLAIQALAYLGKIAIHPTPVNSIAEFVQRGFVGPIPGAAMLACGLMFYMAWLAVAVVTLYIERAAHGKGRRVTMG